MIDDAAKANLYNYLRHEREAVLAKLDGLSEYDVRRPLTVTGTNLLGMVKHLATWEARYLGEVFDRVLAGKQWAAFGYIAAEVDRAKMN